MDLKEIINKIESLKRELDSLKPIKPELDSKFWKKIRLDWNFHSNHLEGNTLTYGETKVLLETGNVVPGTTKPKRDYDEIIGHDKAIDIIKEFAISSNPITEAIIRELHKTILPTPYMMPAQTADGKPTKRPITIGEYKKQPNHVLTAKGEIFKFSTPEDTKPQMMELVDNFRNRNSENVKDILLMLTEFHYKFVLIHPFDDGNGRIARLLLNYFLLKFDYPPIVIKAEDKRNYFSALEASDSGNIESLTIYIGNRIIESIKLMIRAANGEEIEEPEDVDKEILMLQRKVEALDENEIRVEKNETTISSLFDSSIIPFLSYLFEKLTKIDSLFKENNITVLINNSVNKYSKENALSIISGNIKAVSHNIQVFGLYYNYIAFNKSGVNDFNQNIYFQFNFEKYKYRLHYNNGVIFEKLYDSIMTPEEIINISNRMVKDLLSRINRSIDSAYKA